MLKLLKAASLARLRNEIPQHLKNYLNKKALAIDDTDTVQTDIDFDERAAQQLKMESVKTDAEDAQRMFEIFPGLTASQAMDERLWAMVTHGYLFVQSANRWPVNVKNEDEKKLQFIESHYFAKNVRDRWRNNAVSRLWWTAHIAKQCVGSDWKAGVEALFYRTDVLYATFGRPSIAMPLLKVLLPLLIEAKENKEKEPFNRAMLRQNLKELLRLGGYRLLDVMPEQEMKSILLRPVAG